MRKLLMGLVFLGVVGVGASMWMVETTAAKKSLQAKFEVNGKLYANKQAYILSGDRCSTRLPTAKEIAEVRAVLSGKSAAVGEMITIPIQYHHLTFNGQGSITETQRLQQTQVLNDAYAPYNVQFTYNPNTHAPTFTENQSWYFMSPDSAAETACKNALNVSPATTLNFYTGGLTQGLLGWATFPWWLAGNPSQDGVVCLDASLPGGSAAPYNLGDTGTHEVGHWLGLFHTFQGGCVGNGDEVADTVAHASPNFGCPNPNNNNGACVASQKAPVQNFMNYTDDACMDRFTTGQGDRVLAMTQQYRPGLLGDDPNPCDCPLDCIQQSTSLPIRLTDSTLDRLRNFRDLVLAQSDEGRELTQAYYDHSGEIYRLMIMNPGLGAETVRFVMTAMPSFETAAQSEAVVEMSTEQYEQGLILIERFQASGSDKLVKTLDRVGQILAERSSGTGAVTHIDFAPASALVR